MAPRCIGVFFMNTWLKIELKTTGIAILSGLLLTASFPKIDLHWLAWVALVPLLWVLKDVSPGEAFRRGMVFGLAHFVSLLYWLVPTMVTYGHLPRILSIGILFLFAAVLSLVFIAPAIYGISVVGRTPARIIFFFPLFWVGTEFLRSFLFTGFPWELLGYSQYEQLHLIQLSDILGVYGLSGVIALTNAALLLGVLAVSGKSWRGQPVKLRLVLASITAAALSVVAAWIYGDLRIAQVDRLIAQAPKIRVAVIQGNIEQSQKWDRAFQTTTIDTYTRLSLFTRAQKPELIVWPESAAPFYFLAEVPPTCPARTAISSSAGRERRGDR